MRYVSLCSGVEAQTVAWSRLGWTPLAFSEIDPFACAVLACRFPDVPNLGDMMSVDWRAFHEQYGIVDVLFASTPCQSFSVAGNRLGLDGESGLMWGFVRAARDLLEASGGTSPRYVIWENVPGCLSSGPKGGKGEDFRCLLEALDECGYGVSWRVYDSQFARIPDGSQNGFAGPVPQRRRRVYLVGSLGTDGSAEILFERTCLRGDHPSGRKAREALAEHPEGGLGMGDRAGVVTEREDPIVMTTANTNANGSNVNTDGACYTLDGTNCNAIAFAQNTRDEVRLFGGDGQTVGALSAQPGMKQTSYVCMQDGQAKGAIESEQPIVVMDRAAFNQGENAQYPPHIEQTGLMDTLVARGPHAVCYRTEER